MSEQTMNEECEWDRLDGYPAIKEIYERMIEALARPETGNVDQIIKNGVIEIVEWMADDAIAEGFACPNAGHPKIAFLQTWCGFYDPTALPALKYGFIDTPMDCCPEFLWERPDDLYNAWVLEFRLKGIDRRENDV